MNAIHCRMRKAKVLIALVAMLGLNGGASQNAQGAAAQQPSVNSTLPTLYIIGDSTVKNGTAGLRGWGDPIAKFFDPAKINVENRARGGRSSRTYLTEGLWAAVLEKMKPGDFVLMQFGHNDGGSPTTSYRASLKGVGAETRTVTDPKTGKAEIVQTYGWYMTRYVTDTKAKGGLPIVLSPVPRDIWGKDNKVGRSTGNDYGGWAAAVAKAQGIPFVDLNAITADKYDLLGFDKTKAAYFPGDHTHTNIDGAEVNAESVIQGLKGLKNCPLCRFLSPAASALVAVPAAR